MNKFVCLSIGLLALVAATPAHSQSADLVLCDRLAADPSDPDKPADVKGVREIDKSDIATAIKFCRVASASSRRAMFELGRAYAANGQSAEAAAAYRKAADKGSTAAMVELGVMHANGVAVAKDDEQARKLFEKAAQAGNARGVANLSMLGAKGGAPVDPVQARSMLSGAADQNSAEAQFQLGLMLANGVGGTRDDAGARALFEKAAAQNHPGALEWMGSFAQNGRGGPKDTTAAKSYYERAAALGNENAKEILKQLDCGYRIKDKSGKVVGCF